MKVLLYAVFKDQRTRHSLARSDRITLAYAGVIDTERLEVHSLKAEQCSSANAVAGDRLGKPSL